MTRALSLAFVSLLAALPAQYDPKAPEPVDRFKGTLILSSGEAVPAEAKQAFDQLAAKPILHLRPKQGDLGEKLAACKSIWIDWEDAGAFVEKYRGTKVAARLRQLVKEGGVIGAHGQVVNVLTKRSYSGPIGGLDLVPGAILVEDFGDHAECVLRRTLLATLEKHPSLVGLGIERDTALIIHERWLDVVGKGSAHAILAASKKRPLRSDKMNRKVSPASQLDILKKRTGRTSFGRRRRGRGGNNAFRPRKLGDLMALNRAALARVAKRFPAWSPEEPNVPKGTHSSSSVVVARPRGLMEKFIELAGGKDAPLLYIPCQESEQVRGTPGILRSWKRMGCTNVDFIHTKDRGKANSDKELLGKLKKAKGIFLGGGRQWNFVDSYQNTTAHKLMHGVLERGGVIAGSSAGASIQAAYMVRGNSLGNLDAMAEGYETGLGFITGIAVDQHFSQRGRLPDMTGLVDTYPELLGVGLDEAASIIVRGSVAECFSRKGRFVHFYDRTKPVVEGEPDYIKLESGQKFDLKTRKVLQAPKPAEKTKK